MKFKTFRNSILTPLIAGVTGYGMFHFYQFFNRNTSLSILAGCVSSALMVGQMHYEVNKQK